MTAIGRAACALVAMMLAGTPAPIDARASQKLSQGLSLPKGTIVEIAIDAVVGSKISAMGDEFAISLAEPLVIDGRVLLPAGLRGRGQVIHAARARAGGKAGELILAARFLECGDVRVPLGRFAFGKVGKANVTQAFVASSLVSVAGLFISGGNVTVEPGTRAVARVRDDVTLPAPGAATGSDGSTS